MIRSLLFLTLGVISARASLAPREVYPLSDAAVKDLVALDPPEWSSVDEGHLAKLLIPRPCTCSTLPTQ